jgi:predicted NBD/HSP70 family sugar kinase
MNNDRPTSTPANHRLLKNLNNNAILDLVRTDAPISGAQLTKITGMRPSTVQKILKNLQSQGLVRKIGTGPSTKLGGRPPTLWEICAHYGYVIGIQLEINEIQAVLVDLKSQIVAEYQITNDTYDSLHDIEKKITTVIAEILKSKNIHDRQLLGIGIGVSGLVDITRGIIRKTSLLRHSSAPIPLEESLKKYYNIPIYIENDANAAALAEKWFGARKNIDHFIFMLAVIDKDVFGIGFGLLFNNGIYHGANMFAGETNPLDLNIKKILLDRCHYTKRELYDGRTHIDIDKLTIHDLIRAVEHGNPAIKCFFDYIGELFAHELSSVINLLDPQMIVIGGEIAKAKKYILEPIHHLINNNGFLIADRKVQIVESSLAGNSVALGAASIILQKIFQGCLSP